MNKSNYSKNRGLSPITKVHIEPEMLEEIRVAANKDQVLGNDKFKQEIEQILKRRITTYPHGGDRKSETFKQAQ